MNATEFKRARWIWCADRRPNTYCQARGALWLERPPCRASIQIVADSRYQLWVNGRYIGQGPTPFRRPNLYFDSYDVTKRLRAGQNVVAILAHYHGVNHCAYTPGLPGMLARLEADQTVLVTDTTWKAADCRAWQRDVPRRTWATAWCECYDARDELTGWDQPGFDDSAWPAAQLVEQGDLVLWPRLAPPLEERAADAAGLLSVWKAPPGTPALAGLTARLDAEPLTPVLPPVGAASPPRPGIPPLGTAATTPVAAGPALPNRRRQCRDARQASWPLRVEADASSVALTVDLGAEIAGQLELEVEAPPGVVIDLCPAETLRGGRPWCYRKKGEYARRYITRAGRQSWRGFGYDGVRYIHAVVRGPHPALVVHRLGVWRRQSALPIRARFQCGDPTINRLWQISCHTLRVCSQEIHVDCPTREQTSAWGDAVWTGCWAARLTGDASALRHLLRTMQQVQQPDGQLPCYAFSDLHSGPMFDYTLIAARGVWLYLLATGDRALAAELVPTVDRILDWYRRRIGPSGLIEVDCEAARQSGTGMVFIDHPGLGWHNAARGLDRRGINAALNCFFIHALDAQANVLEHLARDPSCHPVGSQARSAARSAVPGRMANTQRERHSVPKAFGMADYERLAPREQAGQLRAEADRVRAAAEKWFYDPARGAYVDGVYKGHLLAQLSQQTNALAVTSGVCPAARAPRLLARVLADDPELCRCGTYFWTYLAQALCQAGLHRQMWRGVVGLWDGMAATGATTWWETFLGDELDSLCHMWSCVPAELIVSEILGVQPAAPGFARVTVQPRCDLLEQVEAVVPLPQGQVWLRWHVKSDRPGRLALRVRSDAPGVLELPAGWALADGSDRRLELAAAATLNLILTRGGGGEYSTVLDVVRR